MNHKSLRYSAAVGAATLLLLAPAWGQTPLIELPLSPDTIHVGSPAFTLKITGTGFVRNSVVKWNGTPLVTTFVNNRQMKAAVPASYTTAAGVGLITVVNPNGSSSETVSFEVGLAGNGLAFTQGTVVSSYIGGVFAADVNGDGKMDLITPEAFYLGNGNGTFGAPSTWTGLTGYPPTSLVVTDFNNDGKPDIAVVGGGTLSELSAISILLGNGDGTFQPPQNPYITGGQEPFTIVAGDFNGDGNVDVAVGNYLLGNLSVLLGDGQGHLGSPLNVLTGGGVTSMAVVDVNNDGILDLVATIDFSDVDILIGNGDGTFKPFTSLPNTSGAYGVAAADLNGDGNQDLVVNYNGVQVYLGDGAGSFSNLAGFPIYDSYFRLADVNGDGKIDILGYAENQSSVVVAYGNGDGTFGTSMLDPLGPVLPYGGALTGFAIADFNGDGRIDLAFGLQDNSFAASGTYVALQSTMLVSPLSLTYKLQTLNTASPKQTITVTDLAGTLDVGPITLTGPDPQDFTFTTGCAVLQVGKSCTVKVAFVPTAEGTRTATLSIANNLGTTQSVPLSGNATEVMLSAHNLAFGDVTVGHSSSQSVVLTNVGTVTLNVTEFKLTKTLLPAFSETNTCSTNLLPGGSCVVTVTFQPQVSGALSGELIFQDSSANGLQDITISGTGN